MVSQYSGLMDSVTGPIAPKQRASASPSSENASTKFDSYIQDQSQPATPPTAGASESDSAQTSEASGDIVEAQQPTATAVEAGQSDKQKPSIGKQKSETNGEFSAFMIAHPEMAKERKTPFDVIDALVDGTGKDADGAASADPSEEGMTASDKGMDKLQAQAPSENGAIPVLETSDPSILPSEGNSDQIREVEGAVQPAASGGTDNADVQHAASEQAPQQTDQRPMPPAPVVADSQTDVVDQPSPSGTAETVNATPTANAEPRQANQDAATGSLRSSADIATPVMSEEIPAPQQAAANNDTAPPQRPTTTDELPVSRPDGPAITSASTSTSEPAAPVNTAEGQIERQEAIKQPVVEAATADLPDQAIHAVASDSEQEVTVAIDEEQPTGKPESKPAEPQLTSSQTAGSVATPVPADTVSTTEIAAPQQAVAQANSENGSTKTDQPAHPTQQTESATAAAAKSPADGNMRGTNPALQLAQAAQPNAQTNAQVNAQPAESQQSAASGETTMSDSGDGFELPRAESSITDARLQVGKAPKGDTFSKMMAQIESQFGLKDQTAQTDSTLKVDTPVSMSGEPTNLRLTGMENFMRTGQLPAQTSAANAQAMAAHIAKFAQKGETRFEIRLDPADLGRVDVRLTIGSDGQARAHLFVEKSETMDFLMRDQRFLERGLQQSGLNIDKQGLEFSLMDQGDQQQQMADQYKDAFEQAASSNSEQDDADMPSTQTAALHPQHSGNYVASDGINLVI